MHTITLPHPARKWCSGRAESPDCCADTVLRTRLTEQSDTLFSSGWLELLASGRWQAGESSPGDGQFSATELVRFLLRLCSGTVLNSPARYRALCACEPSLRYRSAGGRPHGTPPGRGSQPLTTLQQDPLLPGVHNR